MMEELFHQLNLSLSDNGSSENHYDDSRFIIPENVDNPNRNGKPDIIYTVDQLQQGCYDQPKHNDQVLYSDDDTGCDGQPYRHLKYYSIYKKTAKTRKCLPLPINHNAKMPRDIVIEGWLQPSPTATKNGITPAFVVFDNIEERAVIDRSKGSRGYWIQISSCSTKKGKSKKSNAAWYYLQEPCDYTSADTVESQSKLQWDATVILTCVSVILDKVLKVEPESIEYTIEDALHKSSLLQISEEPINEHQKEKLYDFEIGIIATHKEMIMQHLKNCVVGCKESCTFMKSIAKLKKPKHLPNAIGVQIWVQAICMQLHQHLWGGTNIDTSTDHVHVNDAMSTSPSDEIIVTTAAKDALVKKRKKSTDDYDIDDNDDDDDDDEEYSTVAKKSKPVPIKMKMDGDIFSAIALKEQLGDSQSQIPNIICKKSTEDWTVTMSWESIVEQYGTGFTLVGDTDDAKVFYNHIMQKSGMKLENMILAMYALANTGPTSPYYKMLLSHKNDAKQRPVAFIFNNLMCRALEIFKQRIANRQSMEQASAMYLLANILSLLVSREDIKSNDSLSSLIKRAGVDLKSRMEEIQFYIKQMGEYGLAIPKYLKDSLSRAEAKMNRICDSAPIRKADPVPAPTEQNKKTLEVNKSNDKDFPDKIEKVAHTIAKPDARRPGPTQHIPVETKIPRKSSIDNTVPFKRVETAKQAPIGATTNTATKLNPSKVNLTSLLGMKGITKEALGEAKVSKKAEHLHHMNSATKQYATGNPTAANITNSFPNDRKPPPQHQLNNSSDQLHLWESKNLCGWGDVQEISKESLKATKTLPTVAEAINFKSNAFEPR